MDYFHQRNSFGMWIVPDIIPSSYSAPSYVIRGDYRASPQPSGDIVHTLLEYEEPLSPDKGIIFLEGACPLRPS